MSRQSKLSSTGIRDRRDFGKFLYEMATDFRHNHDAWEVDDIAGFLDSMGFYLLNSLDAMHRNVYGREVPEKPDWNLLAHVFMAGRGDVGN